MKIFPLTSKHILSDKKSAYSLIELSITIALIGVILGTGLSISGQSKEKTALLETNKKMDEIEEALRRFTLQFNRLPCPANPSLAENSSNYGLEQDCNAAPPADIKEIHNGSANEIWAGVIPTRTLGLPDTHMLDKWNQRITYIIYTKTALTASTFNTFEVTDIANMIWIHDKTGNDINPNDLQNPVAYVLISHGKDKRGSFTRTGALVACGSGTQVDMENCDHIASGTPDSEFNYTDILDSRIENEYYYDIIRWKTKMAFGEVALP